MKRTRLQNDRFFTLQDEVYPDSVYPFLKNELKRKVDLYGKVQLQGGIYCENLEVDADNVFVGKSVFAEEGINIKGHSGLKAWFHSPVSARHSILVDELSNVRVRFGKTISSKSITLSNSIVYGNVYADYIKLVNSVVLGGVFALEDLQVENCIIGSYSTPRIAVKSNIGLILPMSVSDNPPEFDGKIFTVIPVPLNDEGVPGLYEMGVEDIYPLFEGDRKRYIYSNTLRIFDMKKYEQNLRDNIQKLFAMSTVDLHNFEEIEKGFLEYDSRYFEYIDKQFDLKIKPAYSSFMEIEDGIINCYLHDEVDPESQETKEFSGEEPGKPTDEALLQEMENAEVAVHEMDDESATDTYQNSNINMSPNPLSTEEWIECLRCHEKNLRGPVKYCISCGAPLYKDTMITEDPSAEVQDSKSRCRHCDAILDSLDYVYCPECGQDIK